MTTSAFRRSEIADRTHSPVPRPAAAFSVLVGSLALIGWAFDMTLLKSVVPGLIAMNPVTAVAFILLGAALWAIVDPPAHWRRRIAHLCAGGVAVAAGLKLCDVALGWQTDVDRVLFPRALEVTVNGRPNRMAPLTAFNLLVLACAMVLVDVRTRSGRHPAQVLLVVLVLGSLLPLIGYLYGIGSLNGIGNAAPMALHTAVTFLALAAGLTCARPARGLALLMGDAGVAGIAARRLLPAALLIPVSVGWIRLEGQRRGLYDVELGVAMFVVTNVLMFSALVWWSARLLGVIDAVRVQRATELVGANTLLRTEVSERTLVHAELTGAYDLLNRVSRQQMRAKDEVLAHVSHELRTPLAAIDWFTGNLRDGLLGPLTPDQHDHLDTISGNVKQLEHMIGDFLDATRAETGKLSVECQRVSVATVVSEALETCKTRSVQAAITLESRVESGLPPVWADPARTRQVLINLITNAVKFTPRGGLITITSEVLAEPGMVCVAVTDNGQGIAAADHERVFERLYQAEGTSKPTHQSLGLGLFISRQLVALQGGRIWVESALGAGATFTFTIPLFGLRRLCAPVLSATQLAAGSLTLIALAPVSGEGTAEDDAQGMGELREVLEHTIDPGHDFLVPAMAGTGAAAPVFIIAGCGGVGAEVIARRIEGRLAASRVGGGRRGQATVTLTRLTYPTPAEGSVDHSIATLVSRLEEAMSSAARPRPS